MIMLNEDRFLGDCLETIVDCVDEIVITDTGSVDQSLGIARSFGARVIERPWTGDFSAARNAALAETSSDWILYIDADERLSLPKGGRVADYIDPSAVAGLVRFRPQSRFTRYREWRLFRSDPRIRFQGKIHETMVDAIRTVSTTEGAHIGRTEIEIDHLGYDGDQTKKHARNLPMLREAVRAEPYRIFLWSHLVETLAAVGEIEAARMAARQGLAHINCHSSEKDHAAASMIRQFIARDGLNHSLEILDIIEKGLVCFPEDFALIYLKGRALLKKKDAQGALKIAQLLLQINPDELNESILAFDRLIFGAWAAELAALANLQLGRESQALAYFSMSARCSATT